MARSWIRNGANRLLLVAVIGAALVQLLAPTAFAQDGPNRAALVVRFDDGSLETHCVAFSEPFISGMELLARSGLQVQVDVNSGLGGAVCRLRESGCAFPVQDCFCRCQGAECEYWAYYHWVDGGWQYSQIGASSYRVTDGALDGWSWGPGNFTSGTEPPQISFEQVCADAPASAPPAAAPGESNLRSVGSFLVPAAHAQDISAAPVTSDQPTPFASALSTQLPAYAAYLFLLVLLIGAMFRVTDRRRKAAAKHTS